MIDHSATEDHVALLDALEVGLVWVDPLVGAGTVNITAAKLLGIAPGSIAASEFALTLENLVERCLDRAAAELELARLYGDPEAELKTSWRFADAPTHLGVVCKPAPYPLTAGRIWAFYDNSALAIAMDTANRAHDLLRTNADAMLDPQVLVEGIRYDGHIADLVYRDVNRATCDYLGLSHDELVGHSLLETLPNLVGSGLFAMYSECADTGTPVVMDGFPYDNELLGDLRYYDIRAAQAGPDLVSLTWRDVTDRIAWAREVAASGERYRLLAENMADVVVVVRNGRIDWISNSVADALDAPVEFWIGRDVTDFLVREDRSRYRAMVTEVARGGIHIGQGRICGADGTRHFIHMHLKGFQRSDGTLDGMVASFRIIDQEVAARRRAKQQLALRDQQNRSLTMRLQSQTGRLMDELASAAEYVASILPGKLDGPVRVTSRYISCQGLAGDSFDYRWVDDDHLIVYLIDVSGHGVRPAMISVSVHNMLRFGTLPLLDPAAVLDSLNQSYGMEKHGDNYFTAWYGVYQASTRQLRYACAGHPPALAFAPDHDEIGTRRLGSSALPIGTFPDTEFDTHIFEVPPNTELLLYSDGAYELTLLDGRHWSHSEFVELCSRLSGSPGWSLDTLVNKLRARSESGLFEDDCTLVRLTIP